MLSVRGTLKIASIFLSLLIIITLFCGCDEKKLQFLDDKGECFATISDYNNPQFDLSDAKMKSYAEIVYNEASQILSEVLDCELAEAKKELVDGGYEVHSNLNRAVFGAVADEYSKEEYSEVEFGCAVTNNMGKLVAAFSGGNENINFSTQITQPYSAIKPLSVYAPAIDSGIAYWSKGYLDSPIKQIVGESSKVDWPSNASNTYENIEIPLQKALKLSINTVAVRCLADYGVSNSINFLKESFDFPLSAEQNLVAQSGEEEVLGNLGMGFLREGVSPVQMAGYYQIFANGGKYIEPKAVREIVNSSGKTVYKLEIEPKQVVKTSTAAIMNKLLQTVTESGGTGEMAGDCDVTVGGKTGTGDNGNWFVGFCPEYSCAVWHGAKLTDNTAAQMFSGIISAIPDKKLSDFTITSDVKQFVYCCESGHLKAEKCTNVSSGYFSVDNLPKVCDSH